MRWTASALATTISAAANAWIVLPDISNIRLAAVRNESNFF